MKEEIESKSIEAKQNKILYYYEEFFNGETTLLGISRKTRIYDTGFIYETLEKELKNKTKQAFKNRKEDYLDKIQEKDIDIDVNEIYQNTMFPKFKTIEPKKIIDREDGKQEVIYESKLNKNDTK